MLSTIIALLVAVICLAIFAGLFYVVYDWCTTPLITEDEDVCDIPT